MSLRNRMYALTTPEEVDEFLQSFPTGVVFKAGSCHKTMQGFSYVEEALDRREAISLGFIQVIESRSASNHVADLTGIVHESPQFLLFVDGKAVFDLDNWEITPEALEAGLIDRLGKLVKEESKDDSPKMESGAEPGLEPYLNLAKNFLDHKIREEEFEKEWLTLFRDDASFRSKEVFSVLNSLYGDVDIALQRASNPYMAPSLMTIGATRELPKDSAGDGSGSPSDEELQASDLYQRVGELFAELQHLC